MPNHVSVGCTQGRTCQTPTVHELNICLSWSLAKGFKVSMSLPFSLLLRDSNLGPSGLLAQTWEIEKPDFLIQVHNLPNAPHQTIHTRPTLMPFSTFVS